MKESKMETHITTFTGKRIDYLMPDWRQINIKDISHALSQICRYNGHCPQFYSVAEHSYHCSEMCTDPKDALVMLLHDAAEAYVGDLPSPLKRLLPDYQKIEHDIFDAILHAFKIDWDIDANMMKSLDRTMYAIERNSFQGYNPQDSYGNANSESVKLWQGNLYYWNQDLADWRFRSKFYQLREDVKRQSKETVG